MKLELLAATLASGLAACEAVRSGNVQTLGVGTPTATAFGGTVQVRVWEDQDGDGRQDNNEKNLNVQGARFELFEEDGTTPVKGADGEHVVAFSDASGTAELSVPSETPLHLKLDLSSLPAYGLTKLHIGSDHWDSDFRPDNGMTNSTFAVGQGELYVALDAGVLAPGTVQARVWSDLDGDGRQDNSEKEANIEGVAVSLMEADGVTPMLDGDDQAVMATSNAEGIATLPWAPADRPFKLRFDIAPLGKGYRLTKTDIGSDSSDSDANIASGVTTQAYTATQSRQEFTSIDAGVWAPGSVVARAWVDLDGDGRQDNSEKEVNVKGVRVFLADLSGNDMLGPDGDAVEALTDGEGLATLPWAPADAPFKVRFDLAPLGKGHRFTLPDIGSDSADSDADIATGLTSDEFSATKSRETFTSIDAGIWSPGVVKARVWSDLDGDGRQDNLESTANLKGVRVVLAGTDGSDMQDPSGAIVEAVTDAEGLATLPWAPADAPFKVRFDLAPLGKGYSFTLQDVGSDSHDSDADTVTGLTGEVFSASKGRETFTSIDAGVWAPGTVEARVWSDLDGDGRQDGSEAAANLQGMRVALVKLDGSPMVDPEGKPVEAETDSDGLATLRWAPADEFFKVRFFPSDEQSFTQPDIGSDTADSDVDPDKGWTTAQYRASRSQQVFTSIDAGIWEPGTIIARVWSDLNGDGRQNSNENEANVAGVRVVLAHADGTDVVDASGKAKLALTDASGVATLEDVPTDEPFRVRFDLGPLGKGYRFTTQDVGSNTDDSDANAATGLTDEVFATIKSAQAFTSIDAGVWAPGSVSVRVWSDLNGDGRQNSNEVLANVSSVSVVLAAEDGSDMLGPGGEVVSATSDANGEAELPWAPADVPFRLRFDIAALGKGHRFTAQDVGSDTADSDANVATGLTDQAFSATMSQQAFSSIDAGVWKPGTVTARVWNDLNGDGKQNSNELDANVAGVTVVLATTDGDDMLGPSGGVVSAKSDAKGLARLPWAPADAPFKLRFDKASLGQGFRFAPVDQAGSLDADSAYDSDAGVALGLSTATFAATASEKHHVGIDAGVFAPGTAKVRVWDDLDGDGYQDGSETQAGVAGVIVTLLDAAGEPYVVRDKGTVSATSDANGIADLPFVPADEPFKLRFDIAVLEGASFSAGAHASVHAISDVDASTGITPAEYVATMGGEVFTMINAAVLLPGTATVHVWDDLDGNSRRTGSVESDSAISGVPGVVVRLVDPAGVPILYQAQAVTATTNNKGKATLRFTPADRPFKVEFDYSATDFHGYGIATPSKTASPTDATDSDAALVDPAVRVARTLATHTATRGSQAFDTIALGLRSPGTALVRTFDDRSGDHRCSNSERDLGLAGFEVTLLDAERDVYTHPTLGTVSAITDATGLATLPWTPADEDFYLRISMEGKVGFRLVTNDVGSDSNDSDFSPFSFTTVEALRANKGSQVFANVMAGFWAPGSAVVRVWDDSNGDGKQQQSEQGSNVKGATVTVVDEKGTPLANVLNLAGDIVTHVETDADGIATLPWLPADRPFKLVLGIQGLAHREFFAVTKLDKGSDATDSDFAPINYPGAPDYASFAITESLSLMRGSQGLDHVDAGLWGPGKVTARAWFDEDQDGKLGTADSDHGVAGLAVTLLTLAGAPLRLLDGSLVQATTDARGNAVLFPTPANSAFRVGFAHPEGFEFCQQRAGDSDVDPATGVTAAALTPSQSGEHLQVVAGFKTLPDDVRFATLGIPPPSAAPSPAPSTTPTRAPSTTPSSSPTMSPSKSPSSSPTMSPSKSPSSSPSTSPTESPSKAPTGSPSSAPSIAPTGSPSSAPSAAPSVAPTGSPTGSPSPAPSFAPTDWGFCSDARVAIAVDQSWSIKSEAVDVQVEVVHHLLEHLHIRDNGARLSLSGFSGKVYPIAPRTVEQGIYSQDATADADALVKRFDDYISLTYKSVHDWTDFRELFQVLGRQLGSEAQAEGAANPTLIILSDGYPATEDHAGDREAAGEAACASRDLLREEYPELRVVCLQSTTHERARPYFECMCDALWLANDPKYKDTTEQIALQMRNQVCQPTAKKIDPCQMVDELTVWNDPAEARANKQALCRDIRRNWRGESSNANSPIQLEERFQCRWDGQSCAVLDKFAPLYFSPETSVSSEQGADIVCQGLDAEDCARYDALCEFGPTAGGGGGNGGSVSQQPSCAAKRASPETLTSSATKAELLCAAQKNKKKCEKKANKGCVFAKVDGVKVCSFDPSASASGGASGGGGGGKKSLCDGLNEKKCTKKANKGCVFATVDGVKVCSFDPSASASGGASGGGGGGKKSLCDGLNETKCTKKANKGCVFAKVDGVKQCYLG